MSDRPIFSRRPRVLASMATVAPAATRPPMQRPEDVADEGYAALLEARLLDAEADRLDPERKLRALPGAHDLPDGHPVALRRRAEQSRRAGLALRDAARAWQGQQDTDPAA